MEFEHLIKLINTVSRSDLAGFKYEASGLKIRMTKGHPEGTGYTEPGGALPHNNRPPAGETILPADGDLALVPSGPSGGQNAEAFGNTVTSPLVGTFYAAPSEDAAPFVSVGDTVKKGQTLAIIEAMKLMNEIESEYDGTVTEVLAENGSPVEYGQPLFRIV